MSDLGSSSRVTVQNGLIKDKRDTIIKEERKKLCEDLECIVDAFDSLSWPAKDNLNELRLQSRMALLRNTFLVIHSHRYKIISEALKSASDMRLSSADTKAVLHEAHLRSFTSIQPDIEALHYNATRESDQDWAVKCHELLLKIQNQYIDRIVDTA